MHSERNVLLHFQATIEMFNSNPYVHVTAEQVATLRPGWRKPMPVLVQINGKPEPPWRINMMPTGDGNFYLYLHGDIRKASRTKVSDSVAVDVRVGEAYENGPMHPMQECFRVPLEENAAAKQAWDAPIPSRQKEVLRYFSWLKSDAARARNVERSIHVLSGSAGRFMGRSWKNGK